MNGLRRIAALGALLALAGCGETPPSGASAADPAANPAEFIAEDGVVFTAVLEALLDDPEFRSVPSRNPGGKLVVCDLTPGLSWYITIGQLSVELRDRPEMPVELYNRLKARNRRKIELSGIVSGRVLLASAPGVLKEKPWREEAFEQAYPEARGFVGFWLPAYSSDASTALVRFTFGPTPHGACGTVFLEKRRGVWTVAWRKYAYYA